MLITSVSEVDEFEDNVGEDQSYKEIIKLVVPRSFIDHDYYF